MPNRRKRTRVLGAYKGTLIVRGVSWDVSTRDISLKGARLACSPVPPLGEECIFQLPLAEDIVLEIEGVVVRAGLDEVAFDFTSMPPETYGHLSTLVQLRAANADLIDKEALESSFE